jgi:hypothetical protein
MKLLRLSLENFRGAPNGTWSFTGADGAPLATVIVTGPAASGKTSFLEAIVALKESVGSYDSPPWGKRLLRRGVTKGRIEGTWLLNAAEMARADLAQSTVTTALELGHEGPVELAEPGLRALFQKYDRDPAHGKFEYFPANRGLGSSGLTPQRGPEHEARLRLGKDSGKYGSTRRALVDLALSDGVRAVEEARARGILLRGEQRDSLAPYRKDLARLCPELRLIGVTKAGNDHDLLFERADGAELGLDDLAESERQALLFCATFRWLGLSHSVVLIDEPELHQHADAQSHFVRALGDMGVDNQLFLATGSIELTQAATDPVIRIEARPRS